jgi:NAD(P)H-nitrite reductase large subunit
VPLPEDIVCRCYFVTETEISGLVKERALTSVGQVTEVCSAGGGCGGCRPEIAGIIGGITGEEVDPFAD